MGGYTNLELHLCDPSFFICCGSYAETTPYINNFQKEFLVNTVSPESKNKPLAPRTFNENLGKEFSPKTQSGLQHGVSSERSAQPARTQRVKVG